MPEIISTLCIYIVGIFLFYVLPSDSAYLLPNIINEDLSLKCKTD